jgi:hypothetical protein
MLTPSPAAGNTATGDGVARGRSSTWLPMVLYMAPVVMIALYGALWIALHTAGGRGSTHTLFQSLALAETLVALFLRGRKPVGALAGILAVYLLFQLDPLLLYVPGASRRPGPAGERWRPWLPLAAVHLMAHDDTLIHQGELV